mgnify:FL=1
MFLFFLISESNGLCGDSDTTIEKSLFTIDFGFGSDMFSTKTPQYFRFQTGNKQEFVPEVWDGKFAFVNQVPNPSSMNIWHTGELDHTKDDANVRESHRWTTLRIFYLCRKYF